MISIVIVGASGRMGLSMIRLLPEFPALRLGAAVASAGSGSLGKDAGVLAGGAALGVSLTSGLEPALRNAGVAIDFSTADAVPTTLRVAHAARVPLLIGTTGLAAALASDLDQAARDIPLLTAANTSLGVNVLLQLVEQAARSLPPEFDIGIVESHHRHKKDSPSGTALALGAAVTSGRAGARIGYAALRGGDVVGEHEVQFLGNGENLRLAHSATDRSIFARGALQAAQWLAGQRAGRYQMADIFGFQKQ